VSAYYLACRGKYKPTCRDVGPGHPLRHCAGAGLAVKGAFGVASAMGFAHPGLRALPLGLAGYRVDPGRLAYGWFCTSIRTWLCT
jgi:hypothetical protein